MAELITSFTANGVMATPTAADCSGSICPVFNNCETASWAAKAVPIVPCIPNADKKEEPVFFANTDPTLDEVRPNNDNKAAEPRASAPESPASFKIFTVLSPLSIPREITGNVPFVAISVKREGTVFPAIFTSGAPKDMAATNGIKPATLVKTFPIKLSGIS